MYTAKTPLPDGYRDAFALSLACPTTRPACCSSRPCRSAKWASPIGSRLPADGQDPFELEKPSPFVNVVASTDSADAATDGDTVTDGESADEATTDIVVDEVSGESTSDDDGSNGLAIAALVVGLLGLGTGAVAIVRTRKA